MTPARNPHAGDRRRASLAAIAATATLAASCTAALAAGDGEGDAAGPRFEPPTAAEAQRWERGFLRRDAAARAAPLPAPRAARTLFPDNRVVALYGAANGFGVLGRKTPNEAQRKLRKQARPYRRQGHKPVIKAFDLVAVIATQCDGRRDKCRTRVSDSVIQRYLNEVREFNGRLILDIQPGRANVLDEIDHLREWLREPDVDVAIDAEWNVGPDGESGSTEGSIGARKLNKASADVQTIIDRNDLTQKLLIVHQFREGSVKREDEVRRREKVDLTLNYDGIGSPRAKKAGYRALSSKRLFNGFSLFYKLDTDMMSPGQVLDLRPRVDYVMYQ